MTGSLSWPTSWHLPRDRRWRWRIWQPATGARLARCSRPLADAALDRVVSVNVAEHLADPRGHVVDCYRVLRPGGLLVLGHNDWDTTLFTVTDVTVVLRRPA